jgi:hypothetical protein
MKERIFLTPVPTVPTLKTKGTVSKLAKCISQKRLKNSPNVEKHATEVKINKCKKVENQI